MQPRLVRRVGPLDATFSLRRHPCTSSSPGSTLATEMFSAGWIGVQQGQAPSSVSSDHIQMLLVLVGLVIAIVGYWPVIRSFTWSLEAELTTGGVVDQVVTVPVVEFDVGVTHFRFLAETARLQSDPE